MSREDAVTVDQLITFGELTAQEIAWKVGVELHYVHMRALQIGAPFHRRRTRAQIVSDLAQQLDEIHVRFRMQVIAARRTDPIS